MNATLHKKIILKNGLSASVIRNAGFDGFFTPFVNRKQTAENAEQAEKNGLLYWGLHAPFAHVNGLWEGEVAAFAADFTASVDAAAENGIKHLVTHLTFQNAPPPFCERGARVLAELFAYAAARGAVVDVENMEIPQHVLQILHLGGSLCYDSGHAFAYTPDVDWLSSFRPQTLHLHDNFGMSGAQPSCEDDLHLLPFDGDIDWRDVCAKLKAKHFDGDVVLEVKKSRSDRYVSLSDEQFVALAYARATRLSAMLWDEDLS